MPPQSQMNGPGLVKTGHLARSSLSRQRKVECGQGGKAQPRDCQQRQNPARVSHKS